MFIEKLNSGKYRCRIWDNDLRKRVPIGTFPTRTAATKAGRIAEAELASRGYVQERKDIAFGELCDRFDAAIEHVSDGTQTWYRHALKSARRFFGEPASVRRLTREQVQAYAASLTKRGLAPLTVRDYVKALSIVMGYAIDWRYREDNPTDRVKMPAAKRGEDAIRVITRIEHERLIEAVPIEFGQGRGKVRYPGYRVMVSVMPLIGLRRSEMQGLCWEDIDLDSGTLRVERQLRRNGILDRTLKTARSRRTVHLTERAVRILRAWKLECPPAQLGLVFPSQRGKGQNASTFYRMWNKACKDAGLEGLDPHDLRHTFATWNLAAGVNVVWVSAEMGHENPAITLSTYAHLLESEDSTAVRRAEEWYDSQPGLAKASSHILPTAAAEAV